MGVHRSDRAVVTPQNQAGAMDNCSARSVDSCADKSNFDTLLEGVSILC
jgi:hypothetical protein